MPRLVENVRERAIGMMQASISQPRIARLLGFNQTTIARLNQLIMATGSVLKDTVNKRVPAPAHIQQLGVALQKEWWNSPQARISKIRPAMRWRCLARVEGQGGHMDYWGDPFLWLLILRGVMFNDMKYKLLVILRLSNFHRLWDTYWLQWIHQNEMHCLME